MGDVNFLYLLFKFISVSPFCFLLFWRPLTSKIQKEKVIEGVEGQLFLDYAHE